MLQLLSLDHERLTFAHNRRDERLTDVYKARVIKDCLAEGLSGGTQPKQVGPVGCVALTPGFPGLSV